MTAKVEAARARDSRVKRAEAETLAKARAFGLSLAKTYETPGDRARALDVTGSALHAACVRLVEADR
jgi:hypothetical protein